MTYVLVVQFQIQFLKFCCTGVKGKLAWQYTATHFKQIHPVNLFQKCQIKKVKRFYWRRSKVLEVNKHRFIMVAYLPSSSMPYVCFGHSRLHGLTLHIFQAGARGCWVSWTRRFLGIGLGRPLNPSIQASWPAIKALPLGEYWGGRRRGWPHATHPPAFWQTDSPCHNNLKHPFAPA